MKLLLNKRMHCPIEIDDLVLIAWATINKVPMLEGVSPVKRSDGIYMSYLATEGIESDKLLIALFEARPDLFSKGLEIVELPDGTQYEILEDYDSGYQTAVEIGRYW